MKFLSVPVTYNLIVNIELTKTEVTENKPEMA